ncbi:MAG: multiheme c-type cytochrome [Myxococcota bacterium]
MNFRPASTALLLLIGNLLAGLISCTTMEEPHVVQIKDLPSLPDKIIPAELPRTTARTAQDITIALVGEVRGEIEPCGCPTLPFGGFERRTTQIKRLAESGPTPIFHIDAGDLLVKGFATERSENLARRAKETLALSMLAGVDLWVPGPSDLLAIPADQMKTVRAPPRISATWANDKGELLFPSVTVLEREGVRLGVIGLSDTPPSDSGVHMLPAVKATKDALAALPSDIDLLIAVGSINDEDLVNVRNQVSGISAFFSTRGDSYDDPAPADGKPAIIEIPDRGRYLQVAHIRLGSSPDAPLMLHPDPPTWRARLSSIRKKQIDTLDEEGRGRNLGLINTIPLSSELDQEGTVSGRVERYKEETLRLAAKTAETIDPHTPTYGSSGSCVNCHSNEFARWTLTGHAKAWMVLVERNETQNPECVGCHTTAFGKPGGLGELTPGNIRKFKGVQCEVCHGPLAGHPQDARATAVPITEQTCLPCHDEANSPDFEFESYLARASCQGGRPQIIPQPPE